MTLGLPLTLEEFDDGAQLKLITGIAVAAGVDPFRVEITDIKEEQNRRHRSLLAGSIRVGVAVSAPNRDAAKSIAAGLSPDSINAELVKLGLPPAQILESPSVPGEVVAAPAEPKSTPAPAVPLPADPRPANDPRPLIIGLATALGMIVILVMGWLATRFLLPSIRKKGQDSQLSDLERRFMLDDGPGQSEGQGSIFEKAFDKGPEDQDKGPEEKQKGRDNDDAQPSWEKRYVPLEYYVLFRLFILHMCIICGLSDMFKYWNVMHQTL
jgi:hypothetical protein